MSKNEAFSLLRQRGASRAVVTFAGGNDEGDVEGIVLLIGDEEVRLEPYYGDGEGELTDDQQLAELLAAPVWERYGSFAGDFYVYGNVTYDVEKQTVVMSKDESAYQHEDITL